MTDANNHSDVYELISQQELPPQSDRCPFFVYYTFLWMTPFVTKAKKKRALYPSDIPSLPPNLNCDKVLTKMESSLVLMEAMHKPINIGSLVMRLSWLFIVISLILMGLVTFLSVVQPKTMIEVLKVLDTDHLNNIRNSQKNVLTTLFQETWIWIVINFIAQLMVVIFQSIASTICAEQSIRVSQAISILLYKKLVRISNMTTMHVLSPAVINFINGDARSISNLISNIPRMIAVPFKLLMVVLFLIFQIDKSAMAGFGGIFITLPFISLLVLYNILLEKRYSTARDVRARHIIEIITGLRVVKAYNYQELCKRRMFLLRRKELVYVGRMTLVQSCIHLMGYMTWPAMLLCAFLSMIKAGTFTTTNAYTTAYLFNVFARVLIDLPYLISSLSATIISCHRAKQFLALPEGDCPQKDDSSATEFAIWTLGNPTYSWGRRCHKYVPSSFNPNTRSHKVTIKKLLSLEANYSKILAKYIAFKNKIPKEVLTNMGIDPLNEETSITTTACSCWTDDSNVLEKKPLINPSSIMTDASKQSFQTNRLKRTYIELAKMKKEIDALKSSLNEVEADFSPILKSLDFQIPKGSLVGVGGRVGSGKSSLLLAILGEMALVTLNGTSSARICTTGLISYCSQVPSLFTGTVRFNIQLFLPYDEEKMKLAIKLSYLDADLSELPSGLDTLVGSRGVTLSGGQKARLSLARAIYSDADIYLLDDIFASLDSRVCSYIWDTTIKGYLAEREKTVVLATSQTHYFKYCSRLLIIDNCIVTEITSQSLAAGESFLSVAPLSLNESITESSKRISDEVIEKYDSECQLNQMSQEALIKQEKHTELGSVNPKYYKLWFKAGGTWRFVLYIMMWILCIFMLQLASLLINFWTEERLSLSFIGYLSLFLAFSFGFMVILFVAQFVYMLFTRKAAEKIYYDMEDRLINTKISFYDSNPIGRIINRLTSDTGTCDLAVKNGLASTCENSIFVLGSLLATLLMSWPSIFVLVPLLALFFWIFMGFRAVSPLLRRTTALLNSHVCNFILDTYYNVATLRTYKHTSHAINYYAKIVVARESAFWLDVALYKWLHFTTTLLSVFVSSVVTVSAIITSSFVNGEIFSGTILMNGFDVIMMLIDMCFGIVAMDLSMASVERVVEYANLEPEETKDTYAFPTTPIESISGLSVKNLSLRYQKHLPIVLHAISFTIDKGESVAIVGKTGSGKSSIINALLRLVEPEEGSEILLNGVNLLKTDLQQARSKMTLIPQDPFIFSGTLRSYLSGDKQFSDEELWRVLEKTRLRDYFATQSKQLDYYLSDNGTNVSLGQRQLLTVAHALLRDTEIILLDEATSHVDSAAELVVQDALQTYKGQKIIITIAHRLQSVCNCDKVIVMADGQIVECGTPRALFNESDSLFAKMVKCSTDSEDLINLLTST